jgi:membrane protein required for beta-lactamase induction
MSNSPKNTYNKLYLACISALFAVLLQTMLHDHQYNVLSLNFYMIIGVAIMVFIYLYRKQFGLTDTQYLANLEEHHAIDVLSSEEILKKTDDYEVTRIAKKIINT